MTPAQGIHKPTSIVERLFHTEPNHCNYFAILFRSADAVKLFISYLRCGKVDTETLEYFSLHCSGIVLS